MLALSAAAMGYRVHVYSPEEDSPAGAVSEKEIVASYDDLERVRELARSVDVVTFEFENVPSESLAAIEEIVPVRPSAKILHDTRNRLREKRLMRKIGVPVARFEPVTLDSVEEARGRLGGSIILKTTTSGYDGKGQLRVGSEPVDDVALNALFSDQEIIAEAVVEFEAELSVLVARNPSGEVVTYPVTRNVHVEGILDVSSCPARLPGLVERRAEEIARIVARELELEGVLCVEMFVESNGEVIVNELAPRPHNSGHWTIDAARCSQFEQQVRAVCDLPLGSADRLAPVAMANLLGDLWQGGRPDWERGLSIPGVALHLYGKRVARPGRKMGHLTATGSDVFEALERALTARSALNRQG